jgi:hypothetical protein
MNGKALASSVSKKKILNNSISGTKATRFTPILSLAKLSFVETIPLLTYTWKVQYLHDSLV